jgi:AcrR family transcriptional regulator
MMTTPQPASDPSRPAPRGRPRDPRRSQAIIDAARALLREGGWSNLTFEGVAAKAGVGRPTVYRRWPTKGHLAAEILGIAIAEHGKADVERGIELPDTGNIRADLTLLTQELLDRLTALEDDGIQPGVLAEMALDQDLARQVRAEVLTPDRDHVARVVHHAIERGEVRPDVDPALVMDSIAAQVIYLKYLVGEPVGEVEADRIVDLMVGGLLA